MEDESKINNIIMIMIYVRTIKKPWNVNFTSISTIHND